MTTALIAGGLSAAAFLILVYLVWDIRTADRPRHAGATEDTTYLAGLRETEPAEQRSLADGWRDGLTPPPVPELGGAQLVRPFVTGARPGRHRAANLLDDTQQIGQIQ